MGVYAGRGRGGARVLLAAVLIAAAGCDSESGPSTSYSIAVSVITRGLHPDPDGYTIGVDAGPGRVVGPKGEVVFSGLSGEDHWVRLWTTTIASNCRSAQDNPFLVHMHVTDYWGYTDTTDQTVSITILCDWDAMLKVTVVTTGANAPATYFLAVSSSWLYPWIGTDVAANGTRVLTPMPAGETELRLDTPANCAVSGENTRTVYLVHGQVVETVFEVDCT